MYFIFYFCLFWDSSTNLVSFQCYDPSLIYSIAFDSFYTSSIAWASHLNIITMYTPNIPCRYEHAVHYIRDYVRSVKACIDEGSEASWMVALRCMWRALKGASAVLINVSLSLSLSSLQLGVMISSVSSCSVVSALQAISLCYLGLARLAHESYKWVLRDMIAHVCQDTFALMHKTLGGT